MGWRFSQPLPLIVLHSGFPEVPTFCLWIVILQAFWFFAAPLDTWEGHICSSFLVFRGTPFELSQSYFSCATHPKDPKPLAASWYPDPVLSLDFAGFLMAFLLEIWTYIGPWCWFFLLYVLWSDRDPRCMSFDCPGSFLLPARDPLLFFFVIIIIIIIPFFFLLFGTLGLHGPS